MFQQFTQLPLRAANASVLIEQTIGRGLDYLSG